MFSKPIAALLLVIALFGAAVGGAYIALQVFQPPPDDPALDLPTEGLPDSATGGTGQPANGSPRPRPAPTARPSSGQARGQVTPGATSAPVPGAPAPGADAAAAPGSDAARPAATGSSAPPSAPAAPSAKPDPVFEEVEVPTNTLVAIKLQAPLSSETAKVEDRVEARTTKDVSVRGGVAIPTGTLVVGSVTHVDKGGSVAGAARLDVKFHTLIIPHEPDVPIVVDAIPQEGPSPAKGTKGRVAGGAAGGAALGWLKGGMTGAIAGGAIGGGAGVGTRMVEGRQPAEIPAGAEAQIQLRAPAFVTVQK